MTPRKLSVLIVAVALTLVPTAIYAKGIFIPYVLGNVLSIDGVSNTLEQTPAPPPTVTPNPTLQPSARWLPGQYHSFYQEGIEISFRIAESDNGLSVTDASYTLQRRSINGSRSQLTEIFADGLATIGNQNFVIHAHENNGFYETDYELRCTLRTQATAFCEASTIEFDPNGGAPNEYYGEVIVDLQGK